jgi:hypothetical protein
MWSFDRYRKWIDRRTDWYTGREKDDQNLPVDGGGTAARTALLRTLKPEKRVQVTPTPPRKIQTRPSSPPAMKKISSPDHQAPANETKTYYEIGDLGNESAEDILEELKNMKKKI